MHYLVHFNFSTIEHYVVFALFVLTLALLYLCSILVTRELVNKTDSVMECFMLV